MAKVFFPLDEELGLLPGNLAPRQQEHLVHLASWMPFDKAAQMIEVLLSVQINEETTRRLTERMGACMEVAQTAEPDAPRPHESTDQQPLQRCVFSADGAMVSLVKKQWVETRTLAIGEPQEKRTADGEREIHVGHLSYFSRLADASSFIDLAEGEMRRRKGREAKQASAVMDGADWLQTLIDRYRPDAVRILDFPHAAEHISQLLEALEKAGMRFPPQMLERCLHVLKHRGPRPLLCIADRHFHDPAQLEGRSTHLEYLRSREALMQYPQFRQQGWPLGSGMVESANKNVVEARLKGTGMHWERNNVNPMLALRNAVCNDRWKEMWQKALKEQQRQQALRRKTRTERRAQAFLSLGNLSQMSSPPQSAASEGISPPSSEPTAPPPSSSRPSAHRPRIRETHRDTSRSEQNSSHQTKSEVGVQGCICGTPIVQSKGLGRSRQYCSDRCASRARKRAQREREAKWISCSTQPSQPAFQEIHAPVTPLPPVPAAPLPNSYRPSAHHDTKHVNCSPQRSDRVWREACPCGAALLQSIGGRSRQYCSDRCRQRAHRKRQALVS